MWKYFVFENNETGDLKIFPSCVTPNPLGWTLLNFYYEYDEAVANYPDAEVEE